MPARCPTPGPAPSSRRSSRPRPTSRTSWAGTRATSTRARRTRRARRSRRNLAAIEGGRAAFAFASGMAAINAVATLLKAGDHVVVTDNTYGGTFRLFERVLTRYGLEFSWVDTTRPERIDAGAAAVDADDLPRDADQPDAGADRHRAGGRDRPRARRAPRGGQHVREPGAAAADRARRRSGRPQHDEVPERAQRQRGRRRRRDARGGRRVAGVRAELGRRAS